MMTINGYSDAKSRARVIVVAAWVASAALGACDTTEHGPDSGTHFTCEQATYEWAAIAAEASSGGVCTDDGDCILVSVDLDCDPSSREGAFVGSCPRAISAADEPAFEVRLGAAASEMCARIDPTCRSAPICLRVEAVCEAGICVTRTVDG
ncbi:MAG: hypothetical protein KF901_11925 [Myxococcales bacterium]|nr:hypothetical protein [Myxococcales bacterium]